MRAPHLQVREDMALNNPGAECATAFAALSTTAEAPDHGGIVRDELGEAFAEVILPGEVDAVDPLTTTNTSPTGSYFLCLADASTTGFVGDPTGIDFAYYPHVAIHTYHEPPASPSATDAAVDISAGLSKGRDGGGLDCDCAHRVDSEDTAVPQQRNAPG